MTRPDGPYAAGVRLLPNAVTVLALCAGLSAVQFALAGRFELCIAAVGAAALCDALDGGLARLLDASSRIGAELDSLADLVSFGVSPALVLYIWALQGNRFGWVVALVFAVCMALRLARFNTLIDDVGQPPFAKRFFMGVPAPAAALTAGVPLYLWLHFGSGWWSAQVTVALWALLVAGLMVSRLPTLSLKSVRVAPRLIAPLLVLVGVVAAILLTAPFLGMALIAAGYVALAPVTFLRYRWLSKHPEAWGVPPRERRAVARAARSARRLGLRPPLRRRVAGRASGVMRAAVRRLGPDGGSPQNGGPNGPGPNGAGPNGTGSRPGGQPVPSANRRRLGLRRR